MKLDELQKAKAEDALAALVGQPLADLSCFMGFQRFEFGEPRVAEDEDGEEAIAFDYSLVLNCPWQIEDADGLALSFSTPDQTVAFGQRIDANPPIVIAAEVSDDGSLDLALSEGFALTVSPGEGEMEQWRFIPPKSDLRGHLVLADRHVYWSR
jgi:hypothetical protein